MRVRHRRFSAQVLLWVIPVLLLSSCAAPGYNEREAMLFESRMTVEPSMCGHNPYWEKGGDWLKIELRRVQD